MFDNPSIKPKEDEPCRFDYPITTTLKLYKPKDFKTVEFWNVINKRQSKREFRSLTLEDLSAILWTSSKVKDLIVQDNGYILTHRPSASAGARHPVDILLYSKNLASESLHYYNPFEHTLNQLLLPNFSMSDFLQHVSAIVPFEEGTVIWFLCHPDRTSAKYENSQSLLWRDAGALIHSVQIACCALEFSSCPLGTLGEPFFSEGFSAIGKVFGAGGIIIG